MTSIVSLWILLASAILHGWRFNGPHEYLGTSLLASQVRDARSVASAATITGRVVADDGQTTLRRVLISLQSDNGKERLVTVTDDSGRYSLTNVPFGRYVLRAEKNGFVSLTYGQRRPFEAPRPLEVDQRTLINVDFRLPRGGVVTARITDESGEPVKDVNIDILRPAYFQGQPTMLQSGDDRPLAATDDRGEMRISGLPPGEYYVQAIAQTGAVVSASDPRVTYGRTFFPGTASFAEARRITVGLGSHVDVEFPLVLSRTVRLSGSVMDTNNAPLARPGVQLIEYIGGGIRSRGATGTSDGRFQFDRVFPGQYVLNAMSSGVGYANSTVRVDGSGDVDGIMLQMMPFGSAQGTIEFDSKPPSLIRGAQVSVAAVSRRPGSQSGRWSIGDDLSFKVDALSGPRLFRLAPKSLDGWFLKTVFRGSADVTDVPIDFDNDKDVRNLRIVLTRQRSTVSGDVSGSVGPALDYVVLIFSEDQKNWYPQSRYVGTARPDQAGRFVVEDLPGGVYLAVALDFIEPGAEADADVLQRLVPLATRITLQDSGTATASLKLINSGQ